MAGIISNIIQNSLSGFAAGAITTVGGYAGDALSGVGNYIDSTGQAVGDGIAKKFDGWGQGLAGYGNSGRKVSTAGTSTPKTSVKTSEATKKPGVGQKKVLPATTTTAKKALPASERKLITAPPAKPSTAIEKAKGMGSGAVKKTGPNSTIPTAKKTTVNNSGVNKPANKPIGKANQPFNKSNTNAAGKVIPQAQSKPGYKPKTSTTQKPAGNSSYGGPIPIGGKEGFKPNGKYVANGGFQGPINLGGLGDIKPKSGGNRIDPSAVGGTKSKVGGYGGPINLGSLAKV